MKPPQKKPLIFMPMHFAWEWHNTYERGMAEEAARQGHEVWVMWDYRWTGILSVLLGREQILNKIDENIYELRPLYLIPFIRFAFVRSINALILPWQKSVLVWWMLRKRRVEGGMWYWMFPFVEPLNPRFWGIHTVQVYDVADFWSYLSETYAVIEHKILNQADHIFVSSGIMYQFLKGRNPRVKRVPLGFKPLSRNDSIKEHVKKKIVIGYVGGINERLDFDLLIELIKKHPEWEFRFFGPIQSGWGDVSKNIKRCMQKLQSCGNFIYGGVVDRKHLNSTIGEFSLGIIPYDTHYPLNYFAHPMKLYDYFYAGVPVIATPLAELVINCKEVKIGKDAGEWEYWIQRFVDKKEKVDQKSLRNKALDQQWSRKYEVIIEQIVS